MSESILKSMVILYSTFSKHLLGIYYVHLGECPFPH